MSARSLSVASGIWRGLRRRRPVIATRLSGGKRRKTLTGRMGGGEFFALFFVENLRLPLPSSPPPGEFGFSVRAAVACAEDGGADADERGALLDGGLVVGAHP